jgi:transcriptional regulator with XRE-family HTH domain
MPNRIKDLRKEKGLTLDEMQEKTGINRVTISQYEREKREPKLKTWVILADFFGVTVSYLQGVSDTRDWERNVDSLDEKLNLFDIKNFYDNFTDEENPYAENDIDLSEEEKIVFMRIFDNFKMAISTVLPIKGSENSDLAKTAFSSIELVLEKLYGEPIRKLIEITPLGDNPDMNKNARKFMNEIIKNSFEVINNDERKERYEDGNKSNDEDHL